MIIKRTQLEILIGVLFVVVGTFIAYSQLADIPRFWSAQNLWDIGLIVCWFVIAGGYWHQGLKVVDSENAKHVSLVLPAAAFLVQCILFVKGIFYQDYALVLGAVLVNCAVVFVIYRIMRFK